MRRLLVIRFSSLGDVVLTSTVLEGLHRTQPDAEIWLVTKAAYAALYRDDPRVHRLVVLDADKGSLGHVVRELQDVRFDCILDAHGSLRSRLLRLRLPPAPAVTLRKDSWARWLFVRARLRSRPLRRHAIDRYREMIGAPASVRPRLSLTADDRRRGSDLLPDDPVLCLAPGARHGPKRWPSEHFGALGRRFVDEGRGGVAVVGGPDEVERVEAVAGSIPGAVALAGPGADLRTLAAVMERSRVLVCNDSGLMHVAEAVGTPALALFGPTSRELGFFPTHPGSRVIEHDVPCRPCSRTGARPCRMSEAWCMTRSTVDLVYERLLEPWETQCQPSQLASI